LFDLQGGGRLIIRPDCAIMPENRLEENVMIRICAVAAFVLGITGPVLAAEPSDIAARTEIYDIHTLTLSDKQFLTGDAEAKATVTSGKLRVAQGEGRLPVVVLMHGSGGMGPNIEMWERTFNAMGVSTFALDGFTGRGLTQTSTNQALLGRLNFILDIYRGLDVLAKHPRVDSQRVMLMGFSRGGQAALYASLKRFHQLWNKSGVEFAGYIPFYPDCATTFAGDTDLADKPIRIFGGAMDDYNPIALCKSYAERLKAAGRDVQVTEYPNASHSFDNPLGPRTATLSPQSQSVRNCKIVEEPVGVLMNASTSEAFTYKDGCVALGPHLGSDPEATSQVKQAVTAFVRSVFKLN
jgi:dienelactone hydrolase